MNPNGETSPPSLTCHTCGDSFDPRVLLCPNCQQFTPRGRRLLIWGLAVGTLLFAVAVALMLGLAGASSANWQ